jgi:hypothetical protein
VRPPRAGGGNGSEEIVEGEEVEESGQECEQIRTTQTVVVSQVLHRDALIEGDHRQSEIGEVPQAWRMTNLDRRPDGGDQTNVG